MGESAEHKQARQAQLDYTNMLKQTMQQNLAKQNTLSGLVTPFGQGLINSGQNALKGIAPDSFQLGTRNQIASAFGQSSQNLADFLGSSGQGFGGLAAGPAANLQAQQSSAMGQSYADALNQALGLGLQGSNVLQGQQSIFNPQGYAQLAGQGFQSNVQNTPQMSFGGALGSSILGAGLQAGFGQLGTGVSMLGSGNFGW